MDYLISVVVPVFNVEEYICKCIKSIMDQTYKNIEIIIVDDGSTDRSGILCDELQKKDGRIRVYHKEHSGLADTRNYALDLVKGKYIGFVDGDDYIDREMYMHMIVAMKDDVDVVGCGVINEYRNKAIISRLTASLVANSGRTMDKMESIRELLLARSYGFSVWNKLFRRELFDGIRFPTGRVGEDMPVTYGIFKKCKKTFNNGYGDYHYIHRMGSITMSEFNSKRMDSFYHIEEIKKDVLSNYPALKQEAIFAECRVIDYLLCEMGRSKNGLSHSVISDKEKLLQAYEQCRNSIENISNYGSDVYKRLDEELDRYKKRCINVTDTLDEKLDDEIKYSKLVEFYNVLVEWLHQRNLNHRISDYLFLNGVCSVAIYGVKELGELVYEELRVDGMEIKYVIDKDINQVVKDVPAFCPQDKLPEVDAIIVTAIHYYREIQEELRKVTNAKIYSIQDIVFQFRDDT